MVVGRQSGAPCVYVQAVTKNDVLFPWSIKLFLQNESPMIEYHSPDRSGKEYKNVDEKERVMLPRLSVVPFVQVLEQGEVAESSRGWQWS